MSSGRSSLTMSKSFISRFNNMSAELRSYTLQSLVLHLYEAGEYNRLHGLLIEDWMRIRSANDGHYGGFLSDVQLAWDATEKPDVLRLDMMSRQVRYALLQRSINSLGSNMLPEV